MSMVRCICGIKLKDRVPSKKLRERLRLSVLLLHSLHWYGHVLQKDNDSVMKFVEYEVKCAKPKGRPKRTWRSFMQMDCQYKLNRGDAMDCSTWSKQIMDNS